MRHALLGMTTNDEEYRTKAAGAQREADRALSEVERAAWLRMVQGWLGLVKKRPHSGDAKE